jgi:hypothetical protein
MVTAARQAIANPTARAVHPYGLFTVVPPITPAEPHWQSAGVEYETLPCRNIGGVGAPDCDPETKTIGMPKSFTRAGPGIDTADPFGVYAPYACGPVGNSVSEGQEMATAQLLLNEQNYVEWELWTGHLGAEPNLPGRAEQIADGPLDPVVALTILEAWFHGHSGTVNGLQGIVHMGVGAATVLESQNLLKFRNGSYWTAAGSRVVIGTGYGSGALADDGTYTDRLYITPPMFIFRSDIFTSSSRAGDLFDTRTNDLYAIAERTYLVGWDSCPVSATVELTYPDPGDGIPLPTPEYPLTITSPADGATYDYGDFVPLAGTARPDSAITMSWVCGDGLPADNTIEVDADGNWAEDMLASRAPSCTLTVSQGFRSDSVTVNVNDN